MKTISVLGSTGSIGTQTLDVIEAYPDRFRAGALAANRRWELLAEQEKKINQNIRRLKGKVSSNIGKIIENIVHEVPPF